MLAKIARRRLSCGIAAFAVLTIGLDRFGGAEGGQAGAQVPAAKERDVYAVIIVRTAPPQILILPTLGWPDCQRRLPGMKVIAARALHIRDIPDRSVISPERLAGEAHRDIRVEGSCEAPSAAHVDAR